MNSAVQKWMVIPAAGIGARYTEAFPKQYTCLLDKPILQHTLERLLSFDEQMIITVALHATDRWFSTLPLAKHPRIKTVQGGQTRAESVWNSLQYLSDKVAPEDWIAVHDAVRPALSITAWKRLWQALQQPSIIGAVLGVPVQDTLKQVDDNQRVLATSPRKNLWHAQTPQVFRFDILYRAMQQFVLDPTITDEASAVEKLGLFPTMVLGDVWNWKLTRLGDEVILKVVLQDACNQ